MLGALEALGYLSAASPIHGAGQQQSTGLPLTSGTLVPWLKTALLTGQIVSVDSIRGYWGESVAYYFGWQQFYIRSLLLPALAGLYVWLLRPVDVTVDDDPNVPLYSLLAVVWAIVFVTTWRSKAAEYAFKWGTANAQSGAVLRSEFVGVESVDAVTGAKVLVDPPVKRALRLLFSGLITALSLLVPVGAMITSLNLQGYIVASTGAWNGIPVYVPELAKHARPGELFDPNGDSLVMPLVPVILHAITIQVLNSLFKGVASALTSFENHRSASTHDASMLIKRFAFEACDCYLALFYIAFELQDVPKLRAELVALFTADTVRRVLLETVVPMLLNWKAVRAVATTPRTGKASASAVAAEMEMEPYEDFDDYLEMVIQFGYVTLFASAFPLAPAICMLANSVEIIADSIKLTYLCRRPRPVRTSSIGGWGVCCYVMMLASIYTNIFIIGVASDQMAAIFPSMFSVPAATKAKGFFGKAQASGEHEMRAGMGRYVVLYMVAMEHALLLLLLFSEAFLARAPKWVRLACARREHEQRTPASS